MKGGLRPLGLDHVVLRVRDQAAAQRFYTDVLGCSVDHINAEARLVQLRFGAHLIDLLPTEPEGRADAPEGRADAPDVAPPARGTGLDHFCLSIVCEDLAALRAALVARGVTVDGDVVERRGAYGKGPSLYIRDVDGYRIELKPR